ncbi:hypothetical protein Bca52824_087564 [Brassica carinata]|uniref:Uncharacterized protein n=1 Tax=Brassica carinata TaxID=52824 RepID=A0A8X7TNR9_BRACI|nr:hypothetical protein Bca52824_087564 [Brassica carinata]
MFFYRKMMNDNNTPIDTTNVTTTPLNAAAIDGTVTTAGTNTTPTAAATTTTTLPVGNAADETTFHSLFGAGLYQTGNESYRENKLYKSPTNLATPARIPGGAYHGAADMMICIFSCMDTVGGYDQSCPVMELLTSSWEFLLSRVGHNLMVYLLQHTSIFLPFLGKQHQQVWTSSMYRAKRLKWEMAEKASSGGVGLMEESMLLSLVLWVLYLGKNLNLLNLSNWLGKVNVRHGRLPMAMHLTTSQSLSIGLNLIQTRRRRREERDRKKEMTELRWEGDRSLEL